MADNETRIVLSLKDEFSGPLRVVETATRKYQATLERFSGVASEAGRAVAGAIQALVSLAGARAVFKAVEAYNAGLEDSRIAFATLLASSRDYYTSLGRVAEGQEAWNAANRDALLVQRELLRVSRETGTEIEALTNAFQGAALKAAAAGFTVPQTVEFSVRLAQAAEALGVEPEKIEREARQILSGEMSEKSRFKGLMEAAGLGNERIQQLVRSGRLYAEVMKALEMATIGADRASENFTQKLQRLSGTVKAFVGEGFARTFEAVKGAMDDLADALQSLGVEPLRDLDSLFSSIATGAGRAAKAAADFSRENPGWASFLKTAAEVTGAVVGVSLAMRGVIGVVKWVVAGLAANFTFIRTIIQGAFAFGAAQVTGFVSALSAVHPALGALAAAVAAVGAALAALKIGEWFEQWEVAGLTVADWERLAWAHVEQFGLKMRQFLDGLPAMVGETFGRAYEAVKSFAENAWEKVRNFGEDLKNYFANLDLKAAAASMGQSLWEGLKESFARGARNAGDVFGSAFMPGAGEEASQTLEEAMKEVEDEIARIHAKNRKDWLAYDAMLAGGYAGGASASLPSAPKRSGVGGAGSALGLDQVNQAVERIWERVEKAREKLAQLQGDFLSLQMKGAGDFVGAEELEVRKWFWGVVEEADRQVREAERAYRELVERAANAKGGITEAARLEIEAAKDALDEMKRLQPEKIRIAYDTMEEKLRQALKNQELATRETVARMGEEWAKLTGTREDQLRAETEMLQVELEKQLKEVGQNAAAREALERVYSEKIRQARLAATGGVGEGFIEGMREMARNAETTFEAGKSLAQTFSSAMSDALAAVVSKTRTVGQAFSDMGNTILREINRILANKFVGWLLGSFLNAMVPVPAVAAPGGEGAMISGPMRAFAEGGWVTEPVVGVGASGRRYLIGEAGPELLVPRSKLRATDDRRADRTVMVQPNIRVNVVNQSGVPLTAETRGVSFDAEGAVLEMVMRAARTNDTFRRTMRGMLR